MRSPPERAVAFSGPLLCDSLDQRSSSSSEPTVPRCVHGGHAETESGLADLDHMEVKAPVTSGGCRHFGHKRK
jgi:hypothetical protein